MPQGRAWWPTLFRMKAESRWIVQCNFLWIHLCRDQKLDSVFALSSAFVLVGLGNVAILTFRLVIVGQFRAHYSYLESECRIFGAQSHSCCSKLRGKKQTLYSMRRQAGRQAPNIPMRKFRFHFMGLIYIHTETMTIKSFTTRCLLTTYLEWTVWTPHKKIPVFYKERKKVERYDRWINQYFVGDGISNFTLAIHTQCQAMQVIFFCTYNSNSAVKEEGTSIIFIPFFLGEGE